MGEVDVDGTWKRRWRKRKGGRKAKVWTTFLFPRNSLALNLENKQLCVRMANVDLFLSDFYTEEMYYFCTFHICFYDLGKHVNVRTRRIRKELFKAAKDGHDHSDLRRHQMACGNSSCGLVFVREYTI